MPADRRSVSSFALSWRASCNECCLVLARFTHSLLLSFAMQPHMSTANWMVVFSACQQNSSRNSGFSWCTFRAKQWESSVMRFAYSGRLEPCYAWSKWSSTVISDYCVFTIFHLKNYSADLQSLKKMVVAELLFLLCFISQQITKPDRPPT